VTGARLVRALGALTLTVALAAPAAAAPAEDPCDGPKRPAGREDNALSRSADPLARRAGVPSDMRGTLGGPPAPRLERPLPPPGPPAARVERPGPFLEAPAPRVERPGPLAAPPTPTLEGVRRPRPCPDSPR
jgi:hypothetical protein